MHAKDLQPDEHITLTEAAKITPGRPSTNCLWRWCRRGVRSRGGQPVRLQHIRVGGKIYTTPRWLDEFGEAVAEADRAYFDLQQPVGGPSAEQASVQETSRRRPSPARVTKQRRASHEQADRELEEAGL